MLSLLIAHIIITAFCFWGGILFYKFFPGKNESRPIIFYLFSGLIFLTTLAQIIVLFFPINTYAKLGIASLMILLSIYKWNKSKNLIQPIKFSLSIALFFILWFIILLINAGPVIMDDSESYHIQSIKWIQEFGTVPGLVNLHQRFGFNSSWFSSVALFSFFPGTSGGFTVLNSVISIWLCFWLISKINLYKKENNLHSSLAIIVILIVTILVWPLTRGNAATTNYDFITTCIVLILFTEIFFSKDFSPSIEWVIWPFYLFTVRIVNFPLLILGFAAFIFFIKQKNLKVLLLPIAYCLLLIVPFVIRNVIIAGYPFYPSTNFNLANVDWKPELQLTERLLEYIKYYNRVSTTFLEIEQTKALGSNWIPSWFKYLFSFDKALVISGVAGIILSTIKAVTPKSKSLVLLLAISIIWSTCWFFISPDPRFVYGILLFGSFLFAYHVALLIKNRQLIQLSLNILLIAMIAGLTYYFISKLWKQSEYRNWIVPVQLPQPPVKEFVVDGITFRIPEPINNNWNVRCYGTKLPCLYKIDPGLRLRGKDIRNGFRLEK